MNKAFGKLCKCGHYESEHVALKRKYSIPGPHDLGVFLPHPQTLILNEATVRYVSV